MEQVITQEYVAGFMLSYDLQNVALIKKNRPKWQAGKLNGIGGHIEPGETPVEAMAREFEEETGMKTNEALWFNYAKIHEEGDFTVHFFVTQGDLYNLMSKTDEQVSIIQTIALNEFDTIENLPWLIPLAIDHITDGRPEFCEVVYPVRHSAR